MINFPRKLMLKLVLLISCVALVGGAWFSLRDSRTPVEKHGRLHVEGTRLVGESGEDVVLRGVSFSWHNWWPQFFRADNIGVLAKDWGCTLVRAPIGVEPDGAYMDKPARAVACLDEVVQGAVEQGIYVIIDWHSHGLHPREAEAFFAHIALRYRDLPNVIYEIFNEPKDLTWPEIKTYAQDVIQTIRSIDPNALILVGTPNWSQRVDIVADDPLKGIDNLMYVLRFYANGPGHGQELRDKADYAYAKGLPLFVSECGGMEPTGDGPLNPKEWQLWQTWMNQKNISWTAWSLSNKDETCSMIKFTEPNNGSWRDEDIKEWGLLVRKTLNASQ